MKLLVLRYFRVQQTDDAEFFEKKRDPASMGLSANKRCCLTCKLWTYLRFNSMGFRHTSSGGIAESANASSSFLYLGAVIKSKGVTLSNISLATLLM